MEIPFQPQALTPVPTFKPNKTNPTQSQVLVSMLSTAYEAHFNAPLFYRELQNNTVPRYSKMVSISFLASVVTMIAVRFWAG